ncbi:MAG: TrkH family potassium uptake protein [Actinobacteria bacterium]|nr:MAG: TrkH family potassium uptake protein [Actinomycetota bacterium]
MWIRLRLPDLRVVVHYSGLLIAGLGLAMTIPLVTALLAREWAPALDYLFSIGVSSGLGMLLALVPIRGARLTRAHALVVSAVVWLSASLVAAIPLTLSGSYLTYLDALFDTFSGFTTSGLTLVADLDHMALSHGMWRILTHLIGGQGIIVAAIAFSVGLRGKEFSLYVAEAREEQILPNVLNTVRFIWLVTAVYVTVGTALIFAVTSYLGMSIGRGFLHAFWLSIAAFDTGGFAPQSMNAMYYHSPALELVTLFLMIGGAMNFSLHAQVWMGNRHEIWKSIEMRALAINVTLLSLLTAVGIAVAGVFPGPYAAVRKGLYQLISAHTGTGLQTVYGSQFVTPFGVGFAAFVLAMVVCGGVSSTAGGIKALRVGLIVKSIVQGVRRAMSPANAVVWSHYHHIKRRLLRSDVAALAMTVAILYAVVYVTGGLVGAAYGYPVDEAFFESVSATANVGLSTGVTTPAMPTGLKLLYILQMWAGRLEFIAIFVLMANIVLSVSDLVRGRR